MAKGSTYGVDLWCVGAAMVAAVKGAHQALLRLLVHRGAVLGGYSSLQQAASSGDAVGQLTIAAR